MKIKEISIKNFRGIQSLEKLEIGNLNTFVGKNDAGKSTILHAVACFFDEKFDAKDIFKGKAVSEEVFIEIGFLPSVDIDDLMLDASGLVVIRKVFSPTGKKFKCTPYFRANDYVDQQYQDLWNKKEEALNGLVEDLGGKPERSGRAKTNLQRILAIKELLQSQTRTEILHELGDLLGLLKKVFSAELPSFSFFSAESDLDISATNFQSQFKTLISESLESQKEKTDELEQSIEKDLLVEFEEIRKFMVKNVSGIKQLRPSLQCDWQKAIKFDLNMRFEGEPYEVPMSHKGTGFRRLLMVAYFEYLASKNSISNSIFAIEEPETFLHPAAQEDLLASISALSGRVQFLLTTHSPVFAGANNCRHTILVTKGANSVSEYHSGETLRDAIIRELGIKPDYNLLQNAKFLIFVEGPDDVHFLQSAAQTLRGSDLAADGVLCLIGGGSSLKNYADMDLFQKIAAGRREMYAVLLDGDNGEPTKAPIINATSERCATDGAYFYQLKKREIENYCHPDVVKQVYMDDIRQREGMQSQNPLLQTIPTMTILIEDTTDVSKLTIDLGLRDLKRGFNLSVFERMTLAEWNSTDSAHEIANFLTEVYRRIEASEVTREVRTAAPIQQA